VIIFYFRIQKILENKRYSELKILEIISNIDAIAKDQIGCRFLQQKIEDKSLKINYIFSQMVKLDLFRCIQN
jgi:hypothetical protein